MNAGAAGSLLGSLDWVSRDLRPILVRALDGHEVSVLREGGGMVPC